LDLSLLSNPLFLSKGAACACLLLLLFLCDRHTSRTRISNARAALAMLHMMQAGTCHTLALILLLAFDHCPMSRVSYQRLLFSSVPQ